MMDWGWDPREVIFIFRVDCEQLVVGSGAIVITYILEKDSGVW